MILTNSFGATNIFPTSNIQYRPTHFFYHNGKAVGSFTKGRYDDTLWNLCINPEYQGQGLGNQMMTEIVARYGKHQDLYLFVYKDNAIAIHMYEKAGFNIVEECAWSKNAWFMERKAG